MADQATPHRTHPPGTPRAHPVCERQGSPSNVALPRRSYALAAGASPLVGRGCSLPTGTSPPATRAPPADHGTSAAACGSRTGTSRWEHIPDPATFGMGGLVRHAAIARPFHAVHTLSARLTRTRPASFTGPPQTRHRHAGRTRYRPGPSPPVGRGCSLPTGTSPPATGAPPADHGTSAASASGSTLVSSGRPARFPDPDV